MTITEWNVFKYVHERDICFVVDNSLSPQSLMSSEILRSTILEFCASWHVTTQKKCFITYEACRYGMIALGGNYECINSGIVDIIMTLPNQRSLCNFEHTSYII